MHMDLLIFLGYFKDMEGKDDIFTTDLSKELEHTPLVHPAF